MNHLHDIMNQLHDIITSSWIYSGLISLFGSLWNAGATDSMLGRIFVVTGLSYFIGYSIYGGYLVGFSGGFGGLSYSRGGFHLGDLITFFPMALFTMGEIAKKAFWSVFRWIGLLVLYVVTSFLVGWLLGVGILQMSLSLPVLLIQLGPYAYLLVLSFASVFALSNIPTARQQWMWVSILWAFQILSTALTLLATTTEPLPIATSPLVVSFVTTPLAVLLREFTVLIAVLALILFPIQFGRSMATIAVRQDVLSHVSALSVSQPLACLGQPTQETTLPIHASTPWTQRWFARSTLPVAIEPDVYTYTFPDDQPLYLIASFHDTLAFYRPHQSETPSRGTLIVIAREIVHAVTLRSATM